MWLRWPSWSSLESREVRIQCRKIISRNRQAAHGAFTETVGGLAGRTTGLVDQGLHQVVEYSAVGEEMVRRPTFWFTGQKLIANLGRDHQIVD